MPAKPAAASRRPAASRTASHSRTYAWVVFALMFCLLLSDYMSRQAINALFPILKAEWHISDAQLGSLGGVVPLAVGLLTLPFSILADRWGRVKSIALMVALWSLATVGCAIATTYHEMFIARIFVGVGEAAYGSAGLAMLMSLFPKHLRSTIAGGFTSAAAFGSVIGVALSGIIATHFSWRWSMGVMAIFGFALVIIYYLIVTEDRMRRASLDNTGETPTLGHAKVPIRQLFAGLFPSRSIFFAYLGSALQLFIQGTLFVWLPSYLNRYWGMPLRDAAVLAAGLVLVSGLGQFLCGAVTDRISKDSSMKRWNMAIAYCLLLGTLLITAFHLPPGKLQLAFMGAGVFFLASSFGTCGAIVASATSSSIHSSAFATMTLFNNILGLAAGPFFTGVLADAVGLEVAMRWLPYTAILPFMVYLIGKCFYAGELRRASAG
ncbi:MFS transporter [Castellaniella sp.]|uniref:MFS transporter n=1 Tax=Castellaniella sp. TaxID=1955812 RepID=UPI003C74015F